MNHRKKIYFALIFLLVLALILAAMISHAQSASLKIIFLDVGQGDAILIEQGENQILIDGGPSGKKIMEKLGEQVPFWDRKIDVIVATHPDSDHIGGLVDVIKNYEVGEIIETDAKSGTDVDKALEGLITDKKLEKQIAEKGLKIKFNDEAKLEIIAPDDGENVADEKDTNSGSVVSKLVYGKNRFLFMGDLPLEKEAGLITQGSDLSANVLKVAHHGSKYATSEEFLKAVNPQKAVISVGKGNRYGHPAAETLDGLRTDKIDILRTDELGDIVFECEDKEKTCIMN